MRRNIYFDNNASTKVDPRVIEEMLGALRISLGRYNTEEEVDYFMEVLPKALDSLQPTMSEAIKN